MYSHNEIPPLCANTAVAGHDFKPIFQHRMAALILKLSAVTTPLVHLRRRCGSTRRDVVRTLLCECGGHNATQERGL